MNKILFIIIWSVLATCLIYFVKINYNNNNEGIYRNLQDKSDDEYFQNCKVNENSTSSIKPIN